MQSLFAYHSGSTEPITTDSADIISHIEEIDTAIKTYAPKWPLNKINQVDLAILRCAVWELLFQKQTPPKVVIDEAVELAKEFGTDSSSAFVNGCLGGILKTNDTPNTES